MCKIDFFIYIAIFNTSFNENVISSITLVSSLQGFSEHTLHLKNL